VADERSESAIEPDKLGTCLLNLRVEKALLNPCGV
jgi:hypothetical protein